MGSYPARLQASQGKSSATFGGISAPSAVRQRLWNSTMRASPKRGNNVLLTKAASPVRASRLNTVMLGKTPHGLTSRPAARIGAATSNDIRTAASATNPPQTTPTHLVADVKCQR